MALCPSATLLCTLADMGEWFSFAMLFAHDEPHTPEMWGLPVNLNPVEVTVRYMSPNKSFKCFSQQ